MVRISFFFLREATTDGCWDKSAHLKNHVVNQRRRTEAVARNDGMGRGGGLRKRNQPTETFGSNHFLAALCVRVLPYSSFLETHQSFYYSPSPNVGSALVTSSPSLLTHVLLLLWGTTKKQERMFALIPWHPLLQLSWAELSLRVPSLYCQQSTSTALFHHPPKGKTIQHNTRKNKNNNPVTP